VRNLADFQYSDHKRRSNAKMVRIKLPHANVLVVDDNETNLNVAKGMMKPYEMNVDCVTGGQQAIDAIMAREVEYNAVFMDHMMPGMDGIEAVRRIREIGTDYAKNIPIIACTANAIAGSDYMFLENGFQAFLSKPIDVNRLDDIIRYWIRGRIAGPLPDELAPAPAEDAGFEALMRSDKNFYDSLMGEINVEKGTERFGGDAAVYIDVLRSFAVNTRPMLEILRQVDEDSLADYRIMVHGIKGSSRGVCAAATGDIAEEMEEAAKRGDIEYVRNNNLKLIENLEKLIADLEALFDAISKQQAQEEKIVKVKPDRELLQKLLEACSKFNADEVDDVIREIDSFTYEADDGLVDWLKYTASQYDFSQISTKLSELISSE